MEDIDFKAFVVAFKQSNPQFKGMADVELIKVFAKTAAEKLPELEFEDSKGLIGNYKVYLSKFKDFFKEPYELLTKKVAQKTTLTPVRIVGFIPETSEVIAYYKGDISRIENSDLIKTEAEYKQKLAEDKAKKDETKAKAKATRDAKKAKTGGKPK